MNRFLFLLFACCILVAPIQSDAAEPTSVEKARDYFSRGEEAFRQKQWQEALGHYQNALAIVSRPSILFNIAQCYRLLNDSAQALTFYRRYLSEWDKQNPNQPAPGSEEVNEHIQTLEAQMREQQAREPVQESTQPAQKINPAITQTPAVLATPPSPAFSVEKPSEPAQSSSRPFYKTWWFWTTVGAVAAGTTTALILATASPDSINGVDSSGNPTWNFILE